MMFPSISQLRAASCSILLLIATVASSQTRLRGTVYTPEHDPLIGREKVGIDGGGTYDTDDVGQFDFSLVQELKVGQPARFHVYHVNQRINVSQWIIIKPCDLVNGRKDALPSPESEPIPIEVLRKGDPRLISLNAQYSILGCKIEEITSQFKPASRSPGSHHLPMSYDGSRPIPNQERFSAQKVKSLSRVSPPRRVRTTYRTDGFSNSTAFFWDSNENGDFSHLDDAALPAVAQELGFTPKEVAHAFEAWTKLVQGDYEKGLVALYEGRYSEASKYISKSIPEPAGNLLKRYVPLARAEYEQGHYTVAESALRMVLAVHGDDPLVLHDLGVVLERRAKYPEAEVMCKRALTIHERTLGLYDALLAPDLSCLGDIYTSQKKYALAEPLYKRAVAIDEKALSPLDTDLATDLSNLALLYFEQGRYTEAEPVFRRAVGIDVTTLGPNHPYIAADLTNRAGIYLSEGDYAEAEPLCKRALEINERVRGPDHPIVAVNLHCLARVLDSEQEYKEAEILYKRALDIDEKAKGPTHPDIATDLNWLARLYTRQGNYAEAERLYKRALNVDENALGANDPEVAKDLNSLGLLYYTQERYAESEPLFKRALDIDEKAFGPEDPNVAKRLNQLAWNYKAQGKYAEAKALYERALQIDEKAFGPDHPNVATRLYILGLLYESQKQYSAAEPFYKRALSIYEKAWGPDHHDVGIVAEHLALVLHNLGRHTEAKLYEDQAAKIPK